MCIREYDNSLKLRMSSVKYIHTQRFVTGLTNYFQQFNQLQDALSRMRALSLGEGTINNLTLQRASRIKLDIQTQTPIIVIPIHTESKDALIFNLGNINIENSFLRSSDEGTLSYTNSKPRRNDSSRPEKKCLLDILKIQFTDTNLYSAVRVQRHQSRDQSDFKSNENFQLNQSFKMKVRSKVEFDSFIFKQHSANILEKKSYLFIHLERNLEKELSHNSPDYLIHAKLNSFLFSIDMKQYILVRGIMFFILFYSY